MQQLARHPHTSEKAKSWVSRLLCQHFHCSAVPRIILVTSLVSTHLFHGRYLLFLGRIHPSSFSVMCVVWNHLMATLGGNVMN